LVAALVISPAGRAFAIAVTVALLAACGTSSRGQKLPNGFSRKESVDLVERVVTFPADQQDALRAVARGQTTFPDAMRTGHGHDMSSMSMEGDTVVETDSHGLRYTGSDGSRVERTLYAQINKAMTAAMHLDSIPNLASAGYYLGSYPSPGVGLHYINWHLVDERFDPSHPEMLLIDNTPGRTPHPRLAGFSYLVASDRPPEGFAGSADHWHQHSGMCYEAGIETRDGVARAADCPGTFVPGGTLWMLHAWVVPGYPPDINLFDPTNSRLCPPRKGPDAGWCGPTTQ